MLFVKHNENRAKNIIVQFEGLLAKGENVLDIGLGNGVIAKHIRDKFNVHVEGVDVVDYNETDIKNTIYDGLHLPFRDDSFDTILILETLHHCTDMIQVLKEAKRVAKNHVVIMEDFYENFFEKYLLLFHDYISNIRKGVHCPYYFQSKKRWREIFKEIGLDIQQEKDYISKFFIFDSKHVIFTLRTKNASL